MVSLNRKSFRGKRMTNPKKVGLTMEQRIFVELGHGDHTANIVYQGKESTARIIIRTKGAPRVLVYRDTSSVGIECLLAFTVNDNEFSKATTVFTRSNIQKFKDIVAANPPAKTIYLD
jgi:hypothetical protein